MSLSNKIDIVSPNFLMEMIDGSDESEELERHLLGTKAALELSNVKYFDPGVFLRSGGELIDANPIALLGDVAVKSVMIHAEVFSDKFEVPKVDSKDIRKWWLKTHNSTNGSGIRFFIAKTAVGSIGVDSNITAQITERRTFAAVSLDASPAREIDIKHIFGKEYRHDRDDRDVVIAPTSLSVYASKKRD